MVVLGVAIPFVVLSKTLFHQSPLLKIAVKADKARHLKQREIGLLADLAAPVPRGRQPPVNAAARVIEIVRARAVEAMPEEVGKNNNDGV